MELDMIHDIHSSIDGSDLYYPCSGGDYRMPVRLFAPWVRTFWFVDIAYSRGEREHRHPGLRGLDDAADRVAPALAGDARFVFLHAVVEGPPTDRRYPHIWPCTRTETYLHARSGRVIDLKFRRGYGRSAFRNEVGRIGVFFYRRDSLGEGGSGNLWLTKDSLGEICRHMDRGGADRH